jgi:hypothetical protein
VQRQLLDDDFALQQRLGDIERRVQALDRTYGARALTLAERRAAGQPVDPEVTAALARETSDAVDEVAGALDAFGHAAHARAGHALRAAREHTERARARLAAAEVALLIAVLLGAMSLWNGLLRRSPS